MGRYIRGNVDEELSLGTLASRTLVSTIFDNVVNERTLISSILARWSLAGMTGNPTDGPILVGVAHSDYTDAEIQAVIDQTVSWNEGDKIGQEIASRKVREIGVFPRAATAAEAVVLNDGRPMKTKLNWTLLQGQSLRIWAYNTGASALDTTVPVVRANGHANLWPL